MKSNQVITAFLALLGSFASSRAEFGIIDFETGDPCSKKWIGGFVQIQNSRGTICISTGTQINSVSSGSRFSNDVEGLVATHVDGQSFTPISMRVGEYSLSTFVMPPSPLTVIGTKSDGSEVMFEIYFDSIRDGANGEEDFQMVNFPDSFKDITKLQFGPGKWSIDDFTVDAPATPPLTPGPTPTGSFMSATRLLGLPTAISPTVSNPLVLMDDYSFRNSPARLDGVVEARDSEISVTTSPVISNIVDAVAFEFYTGENTIWSHREGRPSKIAITLADVQNMGYDITSLRASAAHNGTLLLAGYNYSGSDSYYLFKLTSGVISPVVSPSTDLPLASAGSAKPWHFPNHETIGPAGIAFDTSTADSTQDTVVYELPTDMPTFRRIVGEGDNTGFGIMTGLSRIEYQGVDLVVDVRTSQGTARLVYRDGGLVSSASVSINQPVVAESLAISKIAEESDQSGRIVNFLGAVYLTDGELLYRIIGPGSNVGSKPVASALYLATSKVDADKILVRLTFEDILADGFYEIAMGTPRPPPVALGELFVWDSLDLLYIPVDYATKGRTYTLFTSPDLLEWTEYRTLSEFEISPRFSYPIEPSRKRMFFKVEESEIK